MSRFKNQNPPAYQHHKGRNRGRVTIGGRDYDLGPCQNSESLATYDAINLARS